MLGIIGSEYDYIIQAAVHRTLSLKIPVCNFFVFGLAAFLVGFINENNWVRRKVNVFFQSILATLTILAVELISGIILNIVLKLDIWSYKGWFLNVLGQIAFWPAMLWFVSSPLVIWTDDTMRYYLNGEGSLYRLDKLYLSFLNPFAKPFFREPIRKRKKNRN